MSVISATKRLAAAAAFMVASAPALADCEWDWSWAQSMCQHVKAPLKDDARQDLYLMGYAYHDRNTYTPEKLEGLNEKAWGGGYGRHRVDENGNEDALFAFAFLDSHKDPQYQAGYARIWMWPVVGDLQVGAGLGMGIAGRQDMFGGFPFPFILPMFSIKYQRLSIQSVVIPQLNGGINNGNVAFFYGRYTFD
ncbi:lipid IV(A) palmitoyltransferase PagP [Chitinibacteraceae bacterium HSL-7]